MASKLTDAAIRTLPPPSRGNRIFYDSGVTGLGVRVTAAGARAFVFNYRTRLGRERRYTVGSFPDWTIGAARAEASALRRQVDRGGDPLGEIKAQREAPTVADLCERFIAEHLPRRRASTQKVYAQQIAGEILPALGRLRVAEVTFSDVDRLHQAITKRGRPCRANRVISLLSCMLGMAVRWHVRADNPCRGVEKNQEHARRRYLSADELARLTKALTEYSDRQSADIIKLLLLSGARTGEALQARWSDFDLASGTWRKPGATTKQKTEHRVPLSNAAVRLLGGLRQHAPKGAEWVFPAADGSHRRDLKNAWASVCKAADIKGARVHDLRHTYASVLASAGLSLPIIGQLLGHTTPTTTARYSHLFDDPLRTATERASAIITGTGSADVVPLPLRRG